MKNIFYATLIGLFLISCQSNSDKNSEILEFQITDKQYRSDSINQKMVYRVILDVDSLPTNKAMKNTAIYIWESGNKNWDEFTTFLYLPNMNTESFAYGVGKFNQTGLIKFKKYKDALDGTKWKNREIEEEIKETPESEAAPYILITQVTNIFLNPKTDAIVVAKVKAGNVFELYNVTDVWYEIFMFSGEARYIHKSVAQETTVAPQLPSSANIACKEIIIAQDRATKEAMQKYPNDILKQIDYERLLMDRYTMSVFQKYTLPPARYSKLAVECAKNL